ncbi:protein kinase domain-containing protein, partial [Haematococcus lacustris]
VVLQVVRNISLASAPYSAANSSQAAEQWPGPGRALRLYRNVTLLGKRDVELDFDLQRFTLYLDNTSAAQLHLVNLVLANTPTGPRHAFPNNVLLAPLWAVATNRSPSAPLSVRVVNCTLVCPDDLYDYTLYWIGLAASPVPSISVLASWQTTLALQGSLEFRNDSQKLRVQQRDGQGITWSCMAVTDAPFWSPRRLQRTGVSALVPGDPLYPWAKITPIFNEEQLAPSNPYAILFANITLTPDAINRAASNPYPQAGVPLEQNATNATEHQARAAQQQLQAAGGQLVVSSSLTL